MNNEIENLILAQALSSEEELIIKTAAVILEKYKIAFEELSK